MQVIKDELIEIAISMVMNAVQKSSSHRKK